MYLRNIIESAMRIINEAVKGNRNIFEYGDAALKQAILMLSSLESELTEEEKMKLKIASSMIKK